MRLTKKTLVSATPLSTAFISTSIVQEFQDSPNDEEDVRSSQDYMNDLEKEYKARALLAKSKRFFKKGTQRFSSAKATDQTECHKCDEEEVSSYEETEVKALMALVDEERVSVGKESASNDEWVKISIQKVHTLLEIEDNDDRKSFLDYLCIDLNYVEEQRNNLLSKHINLVQELNTCKEQLLVLKQAKLDLFTMQHVNTEMFKENQNLRNELKDLTSITETWLNNSNKVNQCISEQIPTQKKKILGIDQHTEDTSSSRQKDLIFEKSSVDNSNMSITTSNKPRLSEAENSTLPNHDTDKVPSEESERNMTDLSVAISDSSVTDYDLADESSACNTPLPLLEKLTGAEPVFGPKTIKLILKLNSTFKAEILKTLAGKLKNVKIEDDLPLAIVMKELNELKLQISKNKYISITLTKENPPQDPDLQGQQYLFLSAYIVGLFLYEEESNLETLNMSQRTVKHVVAMFLPQLITMTLSGLEKERLLKLRKLRLLKQVNLNHQDQRLPLKGGFLSKTSHLESICAM
ncbi:hypothetical protein Tco_0626836 [Tanacetum coccineum]|uniref:Uncharacterized protein n=1 Tax=Tanacetum coccineum TaxID=301880 RepID=A0ABQ4WKS5_9ASTR